MSYCDLPEFFSYSYPVARKEHDCCECSAPILKGEKYGYFCGKWDGEFRSYRQHITCEEACVYIRETFQDGECIGFGELMSEGSQYCESCTWTDEYRAFTRLTQNFRNIMAKIKWRARRHNLEFRKEQHRRRKCLREGRSWQTEATA